MSDPKDSEDAAAGAALGVIAVVVAAVAAWLLPVAVVLLYAGQWPELSIVEGAVGTGRVALEQRWSDPASAFPSDVRRAMPNAVGWWGAALWALATGVCVVVGAWCRLEPIAARERLGRRSLDPRGARPRHWGRPRDLRHPKDGFVIGRIDGRTAGTDGEAHIAVVAPTRSGKTTRCIIPWLLDHPGPAIVTSTKRDVLDATREAREKDKGLVWVYDPFRPESACWTPLAGCASWSHALRQAHWLADATQAGDSEIARYWRMEAAKLLAPMLHAAALEGHGIGKVLAWLDEQDTAEPTGALLRKKAHLARRQLEAVRKLDPRNRGTTFMSAGSVLAAYRFPEVLATAKPQLTPRGFLDGTRQTLYIVAPERDQRLLAPLIVALLSSILHAAMSEEIPTTGQSTRLRVLLDEAANIAPLVELPRLLAQGAGHGIRFATVWQSLAQMRERYDGAADSVLANSTAKLFMGPVTDQATRGYIRDLIGEATSRERGSSPAPAHALQQLQRDRAVLVSGDLPPMVVALRPWWHGDWKTRIRRALPHREVRSVDR